MDSGNKTFSEMEAIITNNIIEMIIKGNFGTKNENDTSMHDVNNEEEGSFEYDIGKKRKSDESDDGHVKRKKEEQDGADGNTVVMHNLSY